MNLHEHQSKELFRKNKIAVPHGVVVTDASQVAEQVATLTSAKYVAKAQVHAGGRGKAGGVIVTSSISEIEAFCKKLIGGRLKTYQTGAEGQPIQSILIEEASNIAHEYYFGIVLDRSQKRLVAMASSEGGVEIEKVAMETPEKILKEVIDPMVGFSSYQGRRMAFGLGLPKAAISQFVDIAQKLCKLYQRCDFTLLEINPLVLTTDDNLLCVDGKINIDDNALFRLPELATLNDPLQEDERERLAKEHDLSYISLDGSIGCMVNGAGLAMATMDIIKLKGSEPANFLDVGGTADAERVTNAFKIILSDSNVRAILINIFGGIVKCDLIAEGILRALKEVSINVPLVVRLQGTNADEGLAMLAKSGMNLKTAEDLNDAATKVVAAIS